MNRTQRGVAFAAAIALGVVLSALVPIYSQPFVGCQTMSLFVANPHCSYWPEALRGALLVLPVSWLVRSTGQLAALSFLVFLLAFAGGLQGISSGADLELISGKWSISHLVWQMPGLLASFFVLAAAFGFNKWRATDVA